MAQSPTTSLYTSPSHLSPFAEYNTHHRVAREHIANERRYPTGERKVLRRNGIDREAGELVNHTNDALEVVVG